MAIHTLPTLIHRLTPLRRVGGEGLMRVNQQQQTLDMDELNGTERENRIHIHPSTAGHDKLLDRSTRMHRAILLTDRDRLR